MMQVRSLMETRVKAIHPEATVREVADIMREHNIGVVPVCDADRVLGMVTDRDIVVRAIADRRNLDQTRIAEIMSTDVASCYEDHPILQAIELMRDRKVGRLIVMTRDQRLKGILSLGEIVRGLGEERLAGLVRQKVAEVENMTLTTQRVGVFLGLGTLIGAIVGINYLMRNQPEVLDKIRSRVGLRPVGFEGKEAA